MDSHVQASPGNDRDKLSIILYMCSFVAVQVITKRVAIIAIIMTLVHTLNCSVLIVNPVIGTGLDSKITSAASVTFSARECASGQSLQHASCEDYNVVFYDV